MEKLFTHIASIFLLLFVTFTTPLPAPGEYDTDYIDAVRVIMVKNLPDDVTETEDDSSAQNQKGRATMIAYGMEWLDKNPETDSEDEATTSKRTKVATAINVLWQGGRTAKAEDDLQADRKTAWKVIGAVINPQTPENPRGYPTAILDDDAALRYPNLSPLRAGEGPELFALQANPRAKVTAAGGDGGGEAAERDAELEQAIKKEIAARRMRNWDEHLAWARETLQEKSLPGQEQKLKAAIKILEAGGSDVAAKVRAVKSLYNASDPATYTYSAEKMLQEAYFTDADDADGAPAAPAAARRRTADDDDADGDAAASRRAAASPRAAARPATRLSPQDSDFVKKQRTSYLAQAQEMLTQDDISAEKKKILRAAIRILSTESDEDNSAKQMRAIKSVYLGYNPTADVSPDQMLSADDFTDADDAPAARRQAAARPESYRIDDADDDAEENEDSVASSPRLRRSSTSSTSGDGTPAAARRRTADDGDDEGEAAEGTSRPPRKGTLFFVVGDNGSANMFTTQAEATAAAKRHGRQVVTVRDVDVDGDNAQDFTLRALAARRDLDERKRRALQALVAREGFKDKLRAQAKQVEAAASTAARKTEIITSARKRILAQAGSKEAVQKAKAAALKAEKGSTSDSDSDTASVRSGSSTSSAVSSAATVGSDASTSSDSFKKLRTEALLKMKGVRTQAEFEAAAIEFYALNRALTPKNPESDAGYAAAEEEFKELMNTRLKAFAAQEVEYDEDEKTSSALKAARQKRDDALEAARQKRDKALASVGISADSADNKKVKDIISLENDVSPKGRAARAAKIAEWRGELGEGAEALVKTYREAQQALAAESRLAQRAYEAEAAAARKTYDDSQSLTATDEVARLSSQIRKLQKTLDEDSTAERAKAALREQIKLIKKQLAEQEALLVRASARSSARVPLRAPKKQLEDGSAADGSAVVVRGAKPLPSSSSRSSRRSKGVSEETQTPPTVPPARNPASSRVASSAAAAAVAPAPVPAPAPAPGGDGPGAPAGATPGATPGATASTATPAVAAAVASAAATTAQMQADTTSEGVALAEGIIDYEDTLEGIDSELRRYKGMKPEDRLAEAKKFALPQNISISGELVVGKKPVAADSITPTQLVKMRLQRKAYDLAIAQGLMVNQAKLMDLYDAEIGDTSNLASAHRKVMLVLKEGSRGQKENLANNGALPEDKDLPETTGPLARMRAKLELNSRDKLLRKYRRNKKGGGFWAHTLGRWRKETDTAVTSLSTADLREAVLREKLKRQARKRARDFVIENPEANTANYKEKIAKIYDKKTGKELKAAHGRLMRSPKFYNLVVKKQQPRRQ